MRFILCWLGRAGISVAEVFVRALESWGFGACTASSSEPETLKRTREPERRIGLGSMLRYNCVCI